MKPDRSTARDRLLDAALIQIRGRGFTDTSVDDLCAAAGVTKGAFFHHFRSKDALGVAAADRFAQLADSVFSGGPFRSAPDPVDRLLGYVDFRKAMMQGELPGFTCLVGTMAQEIYATHPDVRDACARTIDAHVETLLPDIEMALASRRIEVPGGARGLALYMQAVIQGAFVLAKANNDAQVAASCLDHLRDHLARLFGVEETAQ
ncbi:MAG: TetR/AcrR family transcriptional regulator [Beijerinckiaceae bacterium]